MSPKLNPDWEEEQTFWQNQGWLATKDYACLEVWESLLMRVVFYWLLGGKRSV
jgi:hypothetical protein